MNYSLNLACTMLESLDESDTVSCIASYDTVKDLITSLITVTDGDFSIVDAEFNCESESKEFVLTLEDNYIWIYPMFNATGEGEYIASKIVYVEEICNSKVLKNIDKESEIRIFGDENDMVCVYESYCEDEDECMYCDDCEFCDYCDDYNCCTDNFKEDESEENEFDKLYQDILTDVFHPVSLVINTTTPLTIVVKSK